MKYAVVGGVTLLLLALNVHAVSPADAADANSGQVAKSSSENLFKMKPVVPVWQTSAVGKTAPKQLASNKAHSSKSGQALRPNCPDYDTEADCEATRWCIWRPDANGGYCSSY